MTTTTTSSYDADLNTATDLVERRLGGRLFPEGEREKAIADALNNTWVEGISVTEWAYLAAARV